MSIQVRDANGNIQYLGTGTGTGLSGAPYIPQSNPGDGTNAFLSGAAANIAAATAVNAQLVTAPGDKMVTNAPAVNTQATASVAAGAAGVRHVCTSISFCLSQDATGGTPFTGIVNLRDGATGAGTILGTWTIAVQTAACSFSGFSLGGLNIFGTAATAMTLEFTSTAPGAHTLESCTFTYHDCV